VSTSAMGLCVLANFPTTSGGQFPPLPWFGDQLLLCGLIPHSALVVSESMTEKYKKCNISKIVIAISHPDQWGFWEWLGQTPRLVYVPKHSYYYYYSLHAYAYKMHAQKTQNLRINLVNMVQHHHAASFASQGSGVVLGKFT
jgi:hypothetical protein